MEFSFTLENIFLVLFFVGLLFTLASAILSGAFGHAFGEGSAFDAHGAHPEAMGGDAAAVAGEGTAEVGWAQHTLPTFSPLSPTTISAFLAAAGGIGYASLAWWELDPWVSSLLALGSGIVFAGLLFGLLAFLFRSTQGTSLPEQRSLVGHEAEVTVTIPVGGAGEVAYVHMGQRYVMSGKSGVDSALPQGARVVIREVSPTILVVEETRESWLARTKSGQVRQAK